VTRSFWLALVTLAAAAASVDAACGGSTGSGTTDGGADATVVDGGSDGIGPVPDAAGDAGPDAEASPGDCAVFYLDGSDECSQCRGDHCCGQYNNCNGSYECLEFINCVDRTNCGLDADCLPCPGTDAACPGAPTCASSPENQPVGCCADAYPTGAELSNAFDDCVTMSCPPGCL
jgi:hypothetical protein